MTNSNHWRWIPLVLPIAACGAPDAGDYSGSVSRDSAGVRIVESDHTRPAWAVGQEWHLTQEPRMRIGTADDDPTQQLYQVVDAEVLSDGRVAVVNAGSSEVRMYDGRGRYLYSIGRRGDGPGEFRYPWAIHEVAGDSLLVVDLGHGISIFGADGSFGRQFLPNGPEGEVRGEGFEPVGQFGDGSLLFRSHYRDDPSRTGLARSRIAMIRVLNDGAFAGSLGDYDDQTVNYGGGLSRYLFGPWAKEAAADSTMWYGSSDHFEIREVDFGARTVRIIRSDRPPVSIQESDIAAYRDAILDDSRGTPQEQFMNRMLAESEYASTFPAYADLKVDAVGNLWVEDYRPYTERVSRKWTVFDQAGRLLGDVAVLAGVRVLRIGADYLLGTWTDDLDVEYVVIFGIEKPEA